MYLLSVLLVLVLLSVGVSANTIYVPDQLFSIQQAIDISSDGDSILVRPGTYTENINFQGKSVILVATHAARSTILKPSYGWPLIRLINGEEHAVIRGFTLIGASVTNVVLINSHAYAEISECIVTGYTSGEVAIRCETDSSLISHNLFYGNQGLSCVGIYSGSAQIINNTFDANNRGFFCLTGQGVGRNNLVTNSIQYGIAGSFAALEYNNAWQNHSNYESGARAGVGSLSVDPLYWDIPGRDYRLLPTSPCIDAADPDPRYNDSDGSRGDIGAYNLNYPALPLPVLVISPRGSSDLIRSLTPTFTWKFLDREGYLQAGVEVEVGTDWDWTEAELWSTGEITSADTSILYGGTALEDGESYVVRIRLSNGTAWGEWVEEGFTILLGRQIRVPFDYPTIQSAISASEHLDSILVFPGIYTEQVNFGGKRVALVSAFGPSSTFLRACTITVGQDEDSSAVISGFTFEKGTTTAIGIGGSATPIICNNIFTRFQGADGDGMIIRISNGAPIIRNNIFCHNTKGFACIGSYAPAAPRILNNTFTNNPRGFFSTGPGIAMNNMVINSTDYGIWGNNYATQQYNLVWNNHPDYYSGAVPGTGNLSVDPLMVDPNGLDFSLQPASQAINAGNPEAIYFDPDGTRNDIGAVPFDTNYPSRLFDLATLPASYGYVVSTNPSISWKFRSSTGRTQVAYEVEVGVDRDWTVAEFWQPGVVMSSDSIVSYSGVSLFEGDVCFVRVRLFDGVQWSRWTESGFHIRFPRKFRVPGEVLTIETALATAIDGDSVLVSPGSYSVALNYNGKAVVVASTDGPSVTTLIPASQSYTVADFRKTEAEGAVLTGFTLTGNHSGPFIYILANASPTITGNYFRSAHVSSSSVVIACNDGDPLITRNVFYDCTGLGCVFLERGTARILNNVFDSNDVGVYAANFSRPGLVENNIFTRSRITGILRSSGTIRYNLFWKNVKDIDPVFSPPALDGTNLLADPVFADPLSGDYHLDGSSPCIDAGDPDTRYNDLDHSRNDIGVYPYLVQSGVHVRVFLIEHEELAHVRTVTPKFVWLPVAAGLAPQTAFHIMLGTDSDWSSAELWDSGPTQSADTSIGYQGATLERGKQYWVRLKVAVGSEWSEWRQFAFRVNSLPNVPTPVSPVVQVINDYLAHFAASSNGDAESDPLTFDFYVAHDSSMLHGYDSTTGIHEQESGTVRWNSYASLTENGAYWWSIRAWDGFEYSPWATPSPFWLNSVQEPMIYLMLLSPSLLESNAIPSLCPKLVWSTAEDPDPRTVSTYRLEVCHDSLLSPWLVRDTLTDTTFTLTEPLAVNTRYWWRVKATNNAGDTLWSPVGSFWTWRQGDIDLSRKIDLLDLSALIAYMIRRSNVLDSPQAADLSGDCHIDISDLSRLINYLTGVPAEFGLPCTAASGHKTNSSSVVPVTDLKAGSTKGELKEPIMNRGMLRKR